MSEQPIGGKHVAASSTKEPSRPGIQRWVVLTVLCLVVTVVELDATVVNVALPSISRALHATTSDLAWINDAYILTLAAFMLVGGRLGDQFGHKLMLQLALLLLGVSSVLCALSTNTIELIAARGLLGIGSAGIVPATQALVTLTFSKEERPKAFGIWTAMTIIGLPLGPLLGGWLLDHFWWGSVFLINVPLVVLSLISVQLLIRSAAGGQASRRQDLPGVALSTLGIAGVLFSVIEGPRLGWLSVPIIGIGVAGVLLLVGFLLWERRAEAPVLDLRLLRLRSFVMGSTATVLSYFAFTGIMFILTQHLQGVLEMSPLQAGAGLIPLAVAFTLGAIVAARLAPLVGTRTIVAIGLLVIAAGMVVLLGATRQTGYPIVGVSLALIGLGTGLTIGQALAASLSDVPPALAGAASAVGNSARQIGGAVGVAVLGSVLVSTYAAALESQVTGLPADLAFQARESISEALAVAATLGDGRGASLLRSADSAFVSGMHVAVVIGAALTVLSAVAVFFSLPGGNLAKGGEGEGELA